MVPWVSDKAAPPAINTLHPTLLPLVFNCAVLLVEPEAVGRESEVDDHAQPHAPHLNPSPAQVIFTNSQNEKEKQHDTTIYARRGEGCDPSATSAIMCIVGYMRPEESQRGPDRSGLTGHRVLPLRLFAVWPPCCCNQCCTNGLTSAMQSVHTQCIATAHHRSFAAACTGSVSAGGAVIQCVSRREGGRWDWQHRPCTKGKPASASP
jgi:hypothetical protein